MIGYTFGVVFLVLGVLTLITAIFSWRVAREDKGGIGFAATLFTLFFLCLGGFGVGLGIYLVLM